MQLLRRSAKQVTLIIPIPLSLAESRDEAVSKSFHAGLQSGQRSDNIGGYSYVSSYHHTVFVFSDFHYISGLLQTRSFHSYIPHNLHS